MASTINSIASTGRSEILAPRERFKAWESKLEERALELGTDLPVEDARLLDVARVFGAGIVPNIHVSSANVTYEQIPDPSNPKVRTESQQSVGARQALLDQMRQMQLNAEFTRSIDVSVSEQRLPQETAYVNMIFSRPDKGLSPEAFGSSFAVAVISGEPTDFVTMKVDFLRGNKALKAIILKGVPDLGNPKSFKWEAFYDGEKTGGPQADKPKSLGAIADPVEFSKKLQTAYVDHTLPKFTDQLLADAASRSVIK